jgi:hypothetical protein
MSWRFDMAEVLMEYDTVVSADDGSRWVAQACGRPFEMRVWEGWIEFLPLDPEHVPVRSRRETTQPNRDELVYWASGLSPVYLKGALKRALEPPVRVPALRRVTPVFEEPAPAMVPVTPPPLGGPRPVLDPFDVYAQGEEVLVAQLDALDTLRVRDIARAYRIVEGIEAEMSTRDELVEAIVRAARIGLTPLP